jgi:hypothetical protein
MSGYLPRVDSDVSSQESLENINLHGITLSTLLPFPVALHEFSLDGVELVMVSDFRSSFAHSNIPLRIF